MLVSIHSSVSNVLFVACLVTAGYRLVHLNNFIQYLKDFQNIDIGYTFSFFIMQKSMLGIRLINLLFSLDQYLFDLYFC